MLDRLPFRAVWCSDFEYHQPDGGLPDPLCVVAKELRSGTKIERWLPAGDPGPCPYDTGQTSALVAHNAAAECMCHLVLGWPVPRNILDTYAIFRCLKNGTDVDRGASLLAAAARYGIATITSAAKSEGRSIAIMGRTHAEKHKAELIRYCGTDVEANAALLLAMLPEILERERGLPHALIFGAYMRSIASVEREGIPIDGDLLGRLQHHWGQIRHRLIAAKDTAQTNCYVNGCFSRKRFEDLLRSLGQLDTWPRTEKTGQISLDDDIFRKRAHGHPKLASLYELHYTLDKLKKLTLHVGPDGRHRAVGALGTPIQPRSAGLYPFGTKTGRNAPKGFIFAPAVWVRHLIRPAPGECVIYSDFSAQEVHIAARKSNDPHLTAAVESGDPYTWHALEIGLAPPGATKQTHKRERDATWKPGLLSQFYGTTAKGLAERLGMSLDCVLYQIVKPHHELSRTYWKWSEDAILSAIDAGFIRTRYGWTMQMGPQTKYRTLLNWPIQAAGADILRFAIIGLVDSGVRVGGPIHDAVLTMCREGEEQAHTSLVQRIMRKAAAVAIGYEIPVDSKVVRYPGRYVDDRGTDMFHTIVRLLEEVEAETENSRSAKKSGVSGDIGDMGVWGVWGV
jgi:DNA polymerase-1